MKADINGNVIWTKTFVEGSLITVVQGNKLRMAGTLF